MGLAKRLVDDLGTTRRGYAAFFGVGVFDGSFLPLPIEPFVLPIMAYRPKRAWLMAGLMLAGCIVGAFLFYLLGRFAGEALVEPMIAAFGQTAAYADQIDAIRDDAFLTLFFIGFSPVPLQIGTLGGGVAGVDPFTFLAAMSLSRGLRYFLMALAAVLIGARAQPLFERYQGHLIAGSIVLGLGVVFGAKLAGI